MVDIKTVEDYTDKVLNIWRDYGLLDEQYISRTLYIMCFHKMIEDNACQEAKYMSQLIDATKSMYRASSIEDAECSIKNTDMVEKTYHLKAGMLSDVLFTTNIEENGWKKAFLKVMQLTSEIAVDEDGYYPYASKVIYSLNRTGKAECEIISSNAIADLLCIASDVQDGDRVLDGTIGCGYSVMKCIEGKKDIFLLGVDANRTSTAIAAMYTIIAGVKEYEFMVEDFSAINTPCDMNKVIMDIPFGGKMGDIEHAGYKVMRAKKWMDSYACREAEPLLMAAAIDSLSVNGRFVVIVPPNFLFKQTKSLRAFRKKIVKKGLLKAVVSLPAVHTSTSIKSFILIIESGNEDVLFVDAANFIQRERRNDAYIGNEDKIVLKDILNNKKAVEKVSFLISNEKVLEVGDWSISKYIDNNKDTEIRSLIEINAELRKEYDLLNKLNEMEQNIELFK